MKFGEIKKAKEAFNLIGLFLIRETVRWNIETVIFRSFSKLFSESRSGLWRRRRQHRLRRFQRRQVRQISLSWTQCYKKFYNLNGTARFFAFSSIVEGTTEKMLKFIKPFKSI
jgi:hypothetical protein